MFAPKKPETTADVLSSFRTHLTRLEGVQETHSTLADQKRIAAARLQVEADAAAAEASDAARAIGRLQAIFG